MILKTLVSISSNILNCEVWSTLKASTACESRVDKHRIYYKILSFRENFKIVWDSQGNNYHRVFCVKQQRILGDVNVENIVILSNSRVEKQQAICDIYLWSVLFLRSKCRLSSTILGDSNFKNHKQFCETWVSKTIEYSSINNYHWIFCETQSSNIWLDSNVEIHQIFCEIRVSKTIKYYFLIRLESWKFLNNLWEPSVIIVEYFVKLESRNTSHSLFVNCETLTSNF